jgi:Rieske Fe-S protein
LPEELQKDPLTRGQFLWMGALGTFMGAVLTIPPAVYLLDPAIRSVLQEHSDVPEEWKEVGSVFEIPAGAVVELLVEFTQKQTYDAGQPGVDESETNVGTIPNAVLLSWKDGELPASLETRSEGPLSEAEVKDLERELNVMSNHCAHLGCPVRWVSEEGEILCPCHGGIYDINGEHTGGPPAHGLWRYVSRIREDGSIFLKHEFYVTKRGQTKPGVFTKPYVI